MRLTVIIIVGLICFGFSCNLRTDNTSLVTSSHNQMGAKWNIHIYANDTIKTQADIQHAWRLLDTLNQVLSNFEESSDVTRLSAYSGDSTWIPIHEYTLELMEKSRQLYQASEGAFDITIAPVMKLWRRAFKTKRWPDEQRIIEVQSLVGMQFLELDRKTSSARLLKEGLSLDFGGIGKGYAVDKLFEYLRKRGYSRILIEGGGDLRVGAPPPDKNGWTIERMTLSHYKELITVVDTLSNIAVATSGNRYQYVEMDGKRFQHHIDPNSGYAINDVYQVSVMSDQCWKSDAISTTISILGANKVTLDGYHGYIILGNDPYMMEHFKN